MAAWQEWRDVEKAREDVKQRDMTTRRQKKAKGGKQQKKLKSKWQTEKEVKKKEDL